MEKTTSSFTVYFDSPFWAGIYQRWENDHLQVSKIVFGAEPRDELIYELCLKHWDRLKFSPAVEVPKKITEHPNPKRIQRQAHREVSAQGIGTKAQQALKLQQEQNKQERKTRLQKLTEEEKIRRYELHQQKKKKRHKGR